MDKWMKTLESWGIKMSRYLRSSCTWNLHKRKKCCQPSRFFSKGCQLQAIAYLKSGEIEILKMKWVCLITYHNSTVLANKKLIYSNMKSRNIVLKKYESKLDRLPRFQAYFWVIKWNYFCALLHCSPKSGNGNAV